MPTQRAAGIPSGLRQQQWTGLRGLERCSASAEGWTRGCEGPRSRAQKSKIGPSGTPPNHPSESRKGLNHSKRRGSRHARGEY